MAYLELAVRVGAAMLLTFAAARKIASPAPFRHTLRELRLPRVGALAVTVPAVEVAAAVGLLVAPRSFVTFGLVVGLGLAFAGAGTVALRRVQPISCACYGRAGDGTLGSRQLIALPAWLAVAWVSLITPDRGYAGVQYFAGAMCALTVLTCLPMLPAARENRAYLKTFVRPT